jgi:Leucine-rich repeat (LRR) protein
MDCFSSLPSLALCIIHHKVVETGGLRNALALEAASKQLRALFSSATRFRHDVVVHGVALPCGRRNAHPRLVAERALAAAAARYASPRSHSFWGWLAANGPRVDCLVLTELELGNVPWLLWLRDQPGATLARVLIVEALPTVSLVPLAGMSNLVRLRWDNVGDSAGARHRLAVPGPGDLSDSLEAITTLPALKSLTLCESTALQEHNVNIGNLARCFSSLSPLSSLTSLTELQLLGLCYLASLDFLPSLGPHLSALNLTDAIGVGSLTPVSTLAGLTALTIHTFLCSNGNGGLAALGALGHTLRRLDLEGITMLDGQGLRSALGPMRGVLKELRMVSCMVQAGDMQAAVDELCALTKLELDLVGRMGSSLQFLSPLTALELLDITGSTAESLEPIGGLSALRQLNLGRAFHVSSLQPLSSLSALQQLSIQDGFCLCSLEPLRALGALRHLSIPELGRVSSLEPLSALTGLQRLVLGSGRLVRSLAPLRALTGLRQLKLEDFPRADQATLVGLQAAAKQ